MSVHARLHACVCVRETERESERESDRERESTCAVSQKELDGGDVVADDRLRNLSLHLVKVTIASVKATIASGQSHDCIWSKPRLHLVKATIASGQSHIIASKSHSVTSRHGYYSLQSPAPIIPTTAARACACVCLCVSV